MIGDLIIIEILRRAADDNGEFDLIVDLLTIGVNNRALRIGNSCRRF